jgi:hypothetical protein
MTRNVWGTHEFGHVPESVRANVSAEVGDTGVNWATISGSVAGTAPWADNAASRTSPAAAILLRSIL